jgi:hypothetical protein
VAVAGAQRPPQIPGFELLPRAGRGGHATRGAGT